MSEWFESSFDLMSCCSFSSSSTTTVNGLEKSSSLSSKSATLFKCDSKSNSLKRPYNETWNTCGNSNNRKISKYNDSYEPKSIKELAVSKQKLNELKSWLIEYFDDSKSLESKSPFLLLNGPSGSGKTIALKLLAKEFNIKVIELPTTSIFDESNFLTSSLLQLSIEQKSIQQTVTADSILENRIDSTKPLHSESQMNRFKSFLHNLNYYRKSIFNESSECHKVLVIEDIPSIFFVKPDLLHEELKLLIRKFKSKKIVPIVFIISTTIKSENLEQKILPKHIQNILNFQVITFKPITDHNLSKALQNSFLGKQLNKSQIEDVVLASSGDICHAFNYLKFKYSFSNDGVKSFTKKAKYSKENRVKISSKNDIHCDRNDPILLSHGIAKILYAKRLETGDNLMIDFIKNHPDCDKSKLRNPLKENFPEEIAERVNISCDNLIDWTYENYLDFIHQENDFDLCIDCLQILSDSASIFSNDYDGKDLIENMRISFVTRGMMFNLNRDQSSYKNLLGELSNNFNVKINNQFRSLKPPKMYQLNKEITNNRLRTLELKNESLILFRSEKNLVMDIFPAFRHLPNEFLQKKSLSNFIRYLVEFEPSLLKTKLLNNQASSSKMMEIDDTELETCQLEIDNDSD